MMFFALLTPLVVLGLVWALQRLEAWMVRTPRPARRRRAAPSKRRGITPVRRPVTGGGHHA